MSHKKDLLRKERRLSRTRYAVKMAVKASKEPRLRLSVFRSGRHIYAQVIDDVQGCTCVSASSLEKSFATKGTGVEKASSVGQMLGKRALAKGINLMVLDRGSRRYHGRIAAFCAAVREAGINV